MGGWRVPGQMFSQSRPGLGVERKAAVHTLKLDSSAKAAKQATTQNKYHPPSARYVPEDWSKTSCGWALWPLLNNRIHAGMGALGGVKGLPLEVLRGHPLFKPKLVNEYHTNIKIPSNTDSHLLNQHFIQGLATATTCSPSPQSNHGIL